MSKSTVFVKVLGCGILFLSSLTAAENCQKMQGPLDAQIGQLRELQLSWNSVEKAFSESVKKDFAALSDGVVDELERNRAVKVAFVRRRLIKSLEIKKFRVAELSSAYCSKCFNKNSAPTAVPGQISDCERCPQKLECKSEP